MREKNAAAYSDVFVSNRFSLNLQFRSPCIINLPNKNIYCILIDCCILLISSNKEIRHTTFLLIPVFAQYFIRFYNLVIFNLL